MFAPGQNGGKRSKGRADAWASIDSSMHHDRRMRRDVFDGLMLAVEMSPESRRAMMADPYDEPRVWSRETVGSERMSASTSE